MSQSESTRVMIAVNESSIHGYPHPSISSHRAFVWTLGNIVRNNTSGFKLLFLHVHLPNQHGSIDDTDRTYATPDDFNFNGVIGLDVLEYFVRRCYELGIQCEAWKKTGDPKEVICREVTRVRPDFLVVGCRGLGPFQRVLVGSVSEFCVKHAECPVITINRYAEETPEDPVYD